MGSSETFGTQRDTEFTLAPKMGDACGWMDEEHFLASLGASHALETIFYRAEDASCWHWEPAKYLYRPDRHITPLCTICHHDDGVWARTTSRHLWCQRPKALMLRPSQWFSVDYPLPKLWPSHCLACGQSATDNETVICGRCKSHIGAELSQTLGDGPREVICCYLGFGTSLLGRTLWLPTYQRH